MSHVTLVEILSQPQVWQEVVESVPSHRQIFSEYHDIADEKELIFIGCGSSYYLSISAAGVYSIVTGKKTRASSASEALFYPEMIFPSYNNGYVPVLISRSGMTTEVVRVAKDMRTRFGELPRGVSCRRRSDLIKLCQYPLLVPRADEQSVIMTRSFTSMLLLIQFLAANVAHNAELERELSQTPDLGAKLIDEYHYLLKDIITNGQYSKYIFLGHGPYYGLACEAMLKIKEMALTYSEAFHSFEFRHGPMSMVDNNMLITFFISERLYTQEISLLREMKKLGAGTLVLCEKANRDIIKWSDYVIEINSRLSDEARMVLYMPAVQLLGYYSAITKGFDPDNPNNLTQVVTLG